MRWFPALSLFGCESDSLAFLSDGIAFAEVFVGAHEEVVLGVQCLLREGRAVQVVLLAVVQ